MGRKEWKERMAQAIPEMAKMMVHTDQATRTHLEYTILRSTLELRKMPRNSQRAMPMPEHLATPQMGFLRMGLREIRPRNLQAHQHFSFR